MTCTRMHIDIDDGLLAMAAAKLGTGTPHDTVNRALELAAAEEDADGDAGKRFRDFGQRSAKRMADMDWKQAWEHWAVTRTFVLRCCCERTTAQLTALFVEAPSTPAPV